MRCILFVLLISLSFLSDAQHEGSVIPQSEIRDAFGRALKTKNESDIAGSVYLYDHYLPGSVTVNNKIYKNLRIKLNLEKNIVFFYKDGTEMMASVPVSKIDFIDTASGKIKRTFKNGFPSTGENTNKTFYEVLDSGKAILLKHFGIMIRNSRQIGDAAVIKTYEQYIRYYVLIEGNIYPVRKADTIIDALKNKEKEVNAFLVKNKFKPGNEKDLMEVISFYNNLL